MDELKKLRAADKLKFHRTAEKYRNYYTFKGLLDSCYNKEWIPYCKKTFNRARSVIDYLGKYTHRIAVSYHHIICMDDKTVTFSVKDYDNKGHWKTLTISGVEFIRRFLMHVPQGILSGSVIMGYCVRVRKTKNCRYAEISSDVKSIIQGFMEKKCRKY